MKLLFSRLVTFAGVACLAVLAKAEKAPLSLAELQESDLIVVGTIQQIRIESEPSRIERASGNYDWGIYLTLAVEKVEKGTFVDSQIEFRCFRIKSRRSHMEFLTPSGHRPIPGTGERVRAYLNGDTSRWFAALPNGITAPDANDDASVWPSGTLTDADEVGELRSPSYTYFLALELWGLICVIVVPVAALAILVTRWLARRRKTTVLDAS